MSSWAGKRLLITGAGGFIGSHLAERLASEGATVRAFVRYNGQGSRGWLDTSPLVGEMEVIAGDVRDRDCVRDAVVGVEAVFHLAALVGIPYSYRAPGSYVETNIGGTMNVLQAALDRGIERLVHTSSSEVYGSARYWPIDEAHPLCGQSPYSASKIAADKLAEAFHRSYGLPVVIVRPFNCFGPRQSARAIVPTIIAQLLTGDTQLLTGDTLRLGNVSPRRDLNYIANTVDGFLAAATCREAIGRVVNIGSGREIAISDLALLIGRLMMGRAAHVERDGQRLRPAASEVDRLVCDNRLARDLLGWEPRVSLEDGLRSTIEWMRQNAGRYRPDEYAI